MANNPTPHRDSIAEFFPAFDRRPRDIAYAQPLGYRTTRFTYRRFAETAAQFARELEARGISPGDRVLLWGPNSAEWAATFWGCMLRGAVVVPMDWIATDDFARRVAQQVQVKLLVVSEEKITAMQGTPAIVLENLSKTISGHPVGRPGARYDSPKLDRSSLAEIVFTSGTTAEPKGVMITHGNILANLEPVEQEIRNYLKFEWPFHPIRFLNLLPLSHVFGQFLGLFFPAILSGTVFFEDSFNPADLIREIHDERISVLVAVPRVLDSLKNKLERDIEDSGRAAEFAAAFNAAKGERFYRHWPRFFAIHRQFGLKFWATICGGASLARDTEEFWDRLGIAVVQGYGLTETTSLISLNHPFHTGRGSIGKILPGREIKLGEGGEILVRGDSVATGYWRGENANAASLAPQSEPQWLHTGDIGELDAEGNLYFKGRQKNVIVTAAGMNVYPADLELALRRQPEIRDCIVLAIPQSGDTSAIAVLLLRDSNSDSKAAVERANSQLAEYQHIRSWFVWPEPDFPRTSTGKPRTNLISERIANSISGSPQDTPQATHTNSNTLEDLIARITHRAVADIKPSAKLESDLGLTSLDRVELLSALEDRYLVSFNDADVSGDTTVAELQKFLGQSNSAQSETPDPGDRTSVQSVTESTAVPTESQSVASAPIAASASSKTSNAVPRRTDSAFTFPRWAQRWPANLTRDLIYSILSWPATHILAHPRVRGREKLASFNGQLLIVCNHISEVDTGYIAAALPFRYRYRLAIAMDGERLRAMRRPSSSRGFWGGLLDRMNYFLVTLLFNVFPLPKKSGFREAFHYAGDSVDRGYSLIVFPEGDLTPDGSVKKFRSGIGLLAQNLHIPVLPMRIDGLFELRQKHRRTAPWGHVRVTIGDPIYFPPGTAPEEVAQQLEDCVNALEWR